MLLGDASPNPARIPSALADQPLTPSECLTGGFTRADGVAGRHSKHRLLAVAALDDIEGTVLCRDQRRGLPEDQIGDRAQVPLALQHGGVLGDVRLEPVLLPIFLGRLLEVADHLVDLVAEQGNLTAGLHPDRSGEVPLGDRGCHLGDGAHLAGQVGGQLIDVVGEVLPSARRARDARLAAQLAFDADFSGYGGDLLGEGGERIGHFVDGVGEGGDLTFRFKDDFAAQVAVGDGGHDAGDAAHLIGEVTGHQVHAVGQVFPGTRDTLDLGLAAQLAFGTDLTGDAGDFRGEGVELIDHDVDGVFQFEDLALDLDRDLLREVALLHGRGDVGDVAHLGREVGGELVDVVGEVSPGAGGAQDVGLAAKPAFGTNLARHARDFGGEGVELVDHAVDGVLQIEDLAADIDRDLLRQVPVRDCRRHLGNVAHVGREVAGHEVDVVGQVLPDADDTPDLGLATQLAFRTDLARHARDFRGERVELVDHHVDRVLQLTDLALDVDRDLLGEISTGDGGRDVGDVAHLGGEVAGHRVDVVGQVTPGAGRARNVCLPAQPALGTDLARHARDFRGEGIQLVDHDVDSVLQLEDLALDLDRDLLGQVALLDGGGDVGDVAHLGRQVGGQLIDVIGEV